MFARTDFRSCRIRFNQRLHKRHTQLIPIEVGMVSESNPDCFRSCMTRAYEQSHRSPLDRIGSVIVSGIAHPVKVSGGCEVLRSKGPHDKASCSERVGGLLQGPRPRHHSPLPEEGHGFPMPAEHPIDGTSSSCPLSFTADCQRCRRSHRAPATAWDLVNCKSVDGPAQSGSSL